MVLSQTVISEYTLYEYMCDITHSIDIDIIKRYVHCLWNNMHHLPMALCRRNMYSNL